MLHIIGLILKIIGILFGVILGILVLVVCIALFVPVRYEASANFPGDIEKVKVRAKGSWLLHLVSGRFVYDEGRVEWKLRAAWMKFGEEPIEKKDSAGEEASENGDEHRKRENDEEPETIERHGTAEKPETIERQETKEKPEIIEEQKTVEKQEVTEKQECVSEQESAKDRGTSEKQKTSDYEDNPDRGRNKMCLLWEKLAGKIRAVFQKIKYTFDQICDKMKLAGEKKEQVAAFLENEVHRSAFAKVMKETVWLKRFLKPKRLESNLHFGFEEPYHTGQALAVLSMIYPFVGEYMNIVPDFEKRVLEGDFFIKGRLRMIHLVILAWKLFWDKNFRSTFREVRKLLHL